VTPAHSGAGARDWGIPHKVGASGRWSIAARTERFSNRNGHRNGRSGRGEQAYRRSVEQARLIDFARINRAALALLPEIIARWLPGGRIEGREYLALNPCRSDHRLGSFKINLNTGSWADFAIEDARGRDVVSLAAYLGGIGQVEAAKRLAAMLGIEARNAR
jgi:hypothetical protein